jgi:hypothetical protein
LWATVEGQGLGDGFGLRFGRRFWATIVGFDCGLRFPALACRCGGYGLRVTIFVNTTALATIVGYDCGRRCLATVLGNDDAYVSNFSLTVHPGGYGGSPPI